MGEAVIVAGARTAIGTARKGTLLDVSAFDPVGVNQIKLRFLEAFAAFCVLRASPAIESGEQAELDGNHALVARRGREPGLALRRDGRDIPLADWALEIVDSMRGVVSSGTRVMPTGRTSPPGMQEAKVRDPARTPAARTRLDCIPPGSIFQLCLSNVEATKAISSTVFPDKPARPVSRPASLAGRAGPHRSKIVLDFDHTARYFAG